METICKKCGEEKTGIQKINDKEYKYCKLCKNINEKRRDEEKREQFNLEHPKILEQKLKDKIICNKCGIEKEGIRKYNGKSLLYCKPCKAVADHKWYENNTDYKKAYQDKFRVEHVEYYQDYFKQYYIENSEIIQDNIKRNRKLKPELYGEIANRYVHKRRAKLLGGGGLHTLKEWETIKQQQNNICALCKQELPLTKDHIIPLAKGGSNNIDNIQALCKPCNCQKQARILTEEQIQNWRI